jgi:hypothetical protein
VEEASFRYPNVVDMRCFMCNDGRRYEMEDDVNGLKLILLIPTGLIPES